MRKFVVCTFLVLVAAASIPAQSTGTSTIEFADGSRYEGQVVEGKASGTGTCVFADGSRYEGEWAEGAITGRGVFTFADGGRYEGPFQAGAFEGAGVWMAANGDRFEGGFRGGKASGSGVYTFAASGARLEATFAEGRPAGQATLYLPNGDRVVVQLDGWSPGEAITYYWKDGDSFQGKLRSGALREGWVYRASGGRYPVD